MSPFIDKLLTLVVAEELVVARVCIVECLVVARVCIVECLLGMFQSRLVSPEKMEAWVISWSTWDSGPEPGAEERLKV